MVINTQYAINKLSSLSKQNKKILSMPPKITSSKIAQRLESELDSLACANMPVVKKRGNYYEELQRLNDKYGKTFPKTSDITSIQDHHSIHGNNAEVRMSSRPDFDDYLERDFGEDKEKMKEKILKRVKRYDKQFENLPPLEQDCMFYRRTNANQGYYIKGDGDYEIIKKAQVGDIVTPNNGYIYSAFHEEDTSHYRARENSMLMQMLAPKGSKISRNLEHNGEALFPRNSKFRVLEKYIDESTGNIKVFLEYIPAQG